MNNKLSMMTLEASTVGDPRELTRADVLRTAQRFRWTRKMTKWTVTVAERELPARPLVLEAAGVPPNNSTNSHQAVAILQALGFETHYGGDRNREAEIREVTAHETPQGTTGLASIADKFSNIGREAPDGEWERLPGDLSKNLHHYLYGSRKTEE
jgi:hypothetical protein